MRYPLSQELTQKISERAMAFAQSDLREREWKSSGNIHSQGVEGGVGLRVSLNYLMYQNVGIRPFLMRSLEGKVVPIDGRFVRAVGVGRPGYVHLPGGIRRWRDQRWRHPGIRGKRFLEEAIVRAIQESRPEIQREVMETLRGSFR